MRCDDLWDESIAVGARRGVLSVGALVLYVWFPNIARFVVCSWRLVRRGSLIAPRVSCIQLRLLEFFESRIHLISDLLDCIHCKVTIRTQLVTKRCGLGSEMCDMFRLHKL